MRARDKLARQLEDDFSQELEQCDYIEALDIDTKGLNAKARARYGDTSAASVGGTLCDMIEEFIDDLEWK